jgi:hypothetical protein
MTTRVETFESSANARAVGTLNARDLVAMKQQLSSLEQMLPQYLPRAEAASMYPRLEVPEARASDAPEGIVEDISSIVQKLSSVINQVISAIRAISATPPEGEMVTAREVIACETCAPEMLAPAVAEVPAREPMYSRTLPTIPRVAETPATTSAVVVSPRGATFSRVLPSKMSATVAPATTAIVPAEETKKSRKAARVLGEDDEPAPISYSATEITFAHAELSRVIDARKIRVENVADLVIGNEDELYCVTRFRQMMQERRGVDSKNFMRRFDRLCRKT